MSKTSFPVVRGNMMRITKVDGCGRPIDGAGNMITTEGFVSVALSSQTTDAEEITVTNAGGKVCVRDTGSPTFDGYGVDITFCEVEPCLFALLTGQEPIYNASGEVVGFTMNSKRYAKTGFALEVWTGSPASDACGTAAAGAQPAGYFVLPNVQGGTLGDFTIENAAVTFGVQGANTKDGNSWGTGPYTGAAGTPEAGGYLTNPLDTNDHLGIAWTTAGTPTDSDGCKELISAGAKTIANAQFTRTGGAVTGTVVADFPSTGTTANPVQVNIQRDLGFDGNAASATNPAVFGADDTVRVHWGDGKSSTIAKGSTSADHTYAKAGKYHVVVETPVGINDIVGDIDVT